MKPSYDILVRGNNLRLKDDFLGISTIALIHGRNGPILFDAGGFVSRLGLLKALKSRGLSPADIPTVFLSHLHHDHTGAIGQFPNASHVVRRREYEYAYAPDWYMAPTYVRQDFDRPNLRWELLDDNDVIDFYNDGSLKLIFTPGHSMGHQSFLVSLQQSRPMLLAVDAVPSIDHWNDNVLPGLTTSASQAVRSIARLRAIAERSDAVLVPGHDPKAWPAFSLAPGAYT